MARTKFVFLAVAVLLLQASWCAVSQPDVVMALTSFDYGGGGSPGECDGNYHADGGRFAALSTNWYAGGSRCGKYIRITSKDTGRTVEALVVDECDTQSGCKDNMIATSPYTWSNLGLEDTSSGEVPIVWSDA